MADEITKFEQQRIQLTASLTAVAESMRTAATIAETFANQLKSINFPGALDEGEKKGRKRKAGIAEDGEDKPAKRQRKPKDPNAPKRPASSYIMFQNEIRKDLKEQNPNITNAELLVLISRKWADLSEEDKAVYTKAVANAKEQYSNEKKAYDARSPEEVAKADAAAAAALAAKKAQPRVRAPKAQPAAVAAPAPAPVAETSLSSESEEESGSESDIEDEEPPKKHTVQESSESSEEEEEEEPKPVPKKSKGKAQPAPPPAPTTKEVKKKKSTK